MPKSPIAQRLKEARLAADLSQKKLGIAAGMDEFSASARMNQYETGKHMPDYLTLSQIAKALSMPVSFFYTDSDELAQIISILGRLKKTHLRTIKDKIIALIKSEASY